MLHVADFVCQDGVRLFGRQNVQQAGGDHDACVAGVRPKEKALGVPLSMMPMRGTLR